MLNQLEIDLPPWTLYPKMRIAGSIRCKSYLQDVEDGIKPNIPEFNFIVSVNLRALIGVR